MHFKTVALRFSVSYFIGNLDILISLVSRYRLILLFELAKCADMVISVNYNVCNSLFFKK